MIDNFAILLSTAMIVYVILRATRLNRSLPWFERARPDPAATPQEGPQAGVERGRLRAAPSRMAAVQRALKR